VNAAPEERGPELRWLRRAPAGIAAKIQAQNADLKVSATYARERPRLGVLSGTFNPPTRCHRALAERARKQLHLDEVLWVIPEIPPHKQKLEAPLEDRAAMLLLAIEDAPQFAAAIASHGLLLDIHRALAPHYPTETEVVFLLGRDAAERILLRWPYANPARALEEMFARFEIAVAERGGKFSLPRESLAARFASKVESLEMSAECEAISASAVREKILQGFELGNLVSPRVAAYILDRGLYRGRG